MNKELKIWLVLVPAESLKLSLFSSHLSETVAKEVAQQYGKDAVVISTIPGKHYMES